VALAGKRNQRAGDRDGQQQLVYLSAHVSAHISARI
jgi:hypothetical protein